MLLRSLSVAAPSAYTLRVGGEVPVAFARHQFDANYNVSLKAGTIEDIVAGYGTSVLRLGCDGWSEKCDGTGRVC
jgi:hypothetical protein